MKRFRLVVVGAGHLGSIHARLAQQVPDFELVGLVDPVPAVRNRIAAELKVEAFEQIDDVPGPVHAAVVATPTQYHCEVGLGLLKKGLHLLIEKPLASTQSEADDLVNAAQMSGTVLQVGHVERFNSAFSAAQSHINKPKYIEAIRFSGYTGRSIDIGVVLDLMIHDIDVVLSLVRSSVRRVKAIGFSVFGGHEDVATARLHFENGCVADLRASRVSRIPQRTMHVFTPTCFVTLDFATRTANLVRPHQDILERRVDTAVAASQNKQLLDEFLPCTTLASQDNNAILDELHDFARAIRTSSKPRVTGRQGRNAVALAERILRSLDIHEWDGWKGGRKGPRALRSKEPIPRPHFHQRLPSRRLEAG